MSTYVYIIAHEDTGGAIGPVKVGVSKKPEKRLKSLQTGNPKPLVLYKSFVTPDRGIALHLERAFHATQADKCLYGEWFNMKPGMAEALMRFNLSCALYYNTDFTEDEIHEVMRLVCGAP